MLDFTKYLRFAEVEKNSKVVNVQIIFQEEGELVLDLLQKRSIGTSFCLVNAFSNQFVTVRVAGYQTLVMRKRYR